MPRVEFFRCGEPVGEEIWRAFRRDRGQITATEQTRLADAPQSMASEAARRQQQLFSLREIRLLAVDRSSLDGLRLIEQIRGDRFGV